ncbi:MAG: type II toxin-antitoxin system YafQ family toxin [Clostridia bacterium]|nr:type II toxin-antitoxin system YafQ family toxin [Clostridia bacterium]
MKYSLILTSRFKKGMKRALKRGLDRSLMITVVNTLLEGSPLDAKYKDHRLKGKLKGMRECHLNDNWLLVYTIENDSLTLTLIDTGTHEETL